MIKAYFLPTLISLLSVNACTKDKAQSHMLVEANQIHLESAAMHESVAKTLADRKKDAEIKRDFVRLQKLDSLQQLITLWDEGVIEVPGFEHAHHHEKGERHEHKVAPKMTDESMLEYQRNAKAAIEALQQELENI